MRVASDNQRGLHVLLGLATALLFFGSILLHELGHAYQASREGIRTEAITLWALGGMAFLERDDLNTGPEFRVAVAGPVVTGLLALLFGLLVEFGDPLGISPLVRGLFQSAGSTQKFLLAINLIPAFPLDGGRMFLALIWKASGNRTTAGRISSSIGKGFGGLLVAVGALGLLSPTLSSLLPAPLRIDSLVAILIGFFIYNANRSAAPPPHAEALNGGGGAADTGPRVLDFMVSDFVVAEPGMTITALLEGLERVQIRPIGLVLQDGAPVGMISKCSAEKVPHGERGTKLVSDVMTRKEDIRVLQATDTLSKAGEALKAGPDTAVVLHNGVVVGLLSVSDLARSQGPRAG